METFLRRYVRGDPSAIDEIVDRYEEILLRLATRLSGDPALAQDLVQEAFLRMIERASGMLRVESLLGWLIEVCGNLARDAVKMGARRRVRHESAAVPEAVPPANGRAEMDEARSVLEASLSALSTRQRQAVVLRVWDGLKYREIAAALGISTGEVGALLHHGLNKLAERLTAAGFVH